ncbi:acetyl-CoA acetyltransferase [Arthrobacter sp. RIT-PI-e]|uniref:acetyl-CoA C-acetyltransferase n=1 Tax=Arthrobacter sp. RIT-PI-e TaxID=1681197 RepID=UPI0006765C38|nr:acetyl-CoA C-acetyltransferase [Arthrobacter sp. RIT-PI-e]KNC13457.1 acetyl-CoA acetyltransferase [Arthrobacter sp. RIT-PI-e]
MNQPTDVVILSGARTPQGKIMGALSSLAAVQLGAHAIRGALERAGLEPSAVDYVIMGQVLQAGAGQNPARQSAVAAGIPLHVPAETVNKVCLSGLLAVTHAARMIRGGEADVVVAGGQESMSNAPHLALGVRQGKSYGDLVLADAVSRDGLVDATEDISMGSLTDSGNTERSISRQQQDEIAATSHQRAARATAEGVLAEEIVPVEIPQRKGASLVVDADQGVRPDSTPESMARLRPAFHPEGTITAGNSSPLSDGAAAVVMTTREYADRHGLEYLAVVGAPGQVAGPDTSLHSQPSRAIEAALRKAGWTVQDLDFIEVNEAFAAVLIQSLEDLGYPLEKANLHGGAVALGHPIGASGARLVLHAAYELSRRGSGRAAVSLGGGGGQGEALLLHRD